MNHNGFASASSSIVATGVFGFFLPGIKAFIPGIYGLTA